MLRYTISAPARATARATFQAPTTLTALGSAPVALACLGIGHGRGMNDDRGLDLGQGAIHGRAAGDVQGAAPQGPHVGLVEPLRQLDANLAATAP